MITIYLDMDEVLVDFIGGYIKMMGLDYQQVMSHHKRGEWAIMDTLTRAMKLPKPMSVEQFWAPIDGDCQFWEKLEPLPWCDRLWKEVHKLTQDVHIISSPSHCDSSYTGKVRWLKRKFGRDFTRFMLTPHKEILAKPNSILIDDRESNCNKFCKAGGRSVIFPRYCNGIGEVADPVEYVMDELRTQILLMETS